MTLHRLVSEITIGEFKFRYTTKITITKSFDKMTDTATIVMPNKFLKDNKTITVGSNNVFKKNDPVTIKIGYFPNLKTEFEGFISKITPDSPLKLECQDRMFLLKQVNLDSKTFTDATIKDVVSYVAPDETVVYDDENTHIGDFQIDNKSFVNAVKVFEVLNKQFGLKIFYKSGVLQVRILTSILTQAGDTIGMSFQKHIISSQLAYVKEEDLDLVIKAESILDDNKRIILYGSKSEGKVIVSKTKIQAAQTKPMVKYNFTEAQLKAEIERTIDDFIYEGYSGKYKTFLEPSVDPEDKVQLFDNKNLEREGIYSVRSVSKEFGVSGGRQTVELRNKVA